MKQLHQSTHAQVEAILTPEQQEKFKQMRKEGMGHRKEGAKDEGDSKQPQ
jgi:Spy/CpxP family protein refolding chaperone